MWIRYDIDTNQFVTSNHIMHKPSHARHWVGKRVGQLPLQVIVSHGAPRSVWLETVPTPKQIQPVAEGRWPTIWETFLAHCQMVRASQ